MPKVAIETQFFSQIFTKIAFVPVFFFQNFGCGAKNLVQIGSFYCSGGAQKRNLVDLKKKGRQMLSKKLENPPRIPPPLEKIVDPPLGSRPTMICTGWSTFRHHYPTKKTKKDQYIARKSGTQERVSA